MEVLTQPLNPQRGPFYVRISFSNCEYDHSKSSILKSNKVPSGDLGIRRFILSPTPDNAQASPHRKITNNETPSEVSQHQLLLHDLPQKVLRRKELIIFP